MKRFFGLLKAKTTPTRLIDEDDVIRLQKQDGHVRQCTVRNWEQKLLHLVELHTIYNDGSKNLPNIYIVYGKRIIDLSGLIDEEHVVSLAKVELAHAKEDDALILICSGRTD